MPNKESHTLYLDLLKRKLLYRSLHRGCKETDYILGNFAKAYLDDLTLDELLYFEEILEQSDNDIYYWCTKSPRPKHLKANDVLDKLINFTINAKI